MSNISKMVQHAVLKCTEDRPIITYAWQISFHLSLFNAGWPFYRQYENPWQFRDGPQHSSAALGMFSVTHIMPILSGGGRNLTVHDPKPYI